MSRPHPADDDRNRLHYSERLVLIVFGLMLAGADVGGPAGTLFRGCGWVVVAAAAGVIEVFIAGYYRMKRWRAA